MDCLYFRERPARDLSLLALHGFLGDRGSLARVTSQVERSFVRTESLLLPGHAGAPWDPTWRWDDVVGALNERTDAEGNVLVGYSMGARVALSMLLDAPERYAGAVLVGVDAGIEDAALRDERVVWERAMSEAILCDGLEAFGARWESLPVFASQRLLPEPVRAELRSRRAQHEPEGVAWAMRALGTGAMPSRWGELASLSVPVALVTGALDEKFTAIARRMSARSERIHARVIEGVGHDVTIEAPEAVAEALEFVRGEAGRR
jgi:2-succinyl-6-hydroxy-2,4-cyclohexadiene-1-carboxylate synthase